MEISADTNTLALSAGRGTHHQGLRRKDVQAVWADFDAFRRAAEEKASKDNDKRKTDSITASAATNS
jgi:hypothetical protein